LAVGQELAANGFETYSKAACRAARILLVTRDTVHLVR
jgi:hypothetical protein